MHKVLMVGLGGFIGTVSRYLVSGFVQNMAQSNSFPHGTLVVNLSGCFLVGLLSHFIEMQASMAAELRLFLMVGIIGSFTTYATFSNETMSLLQDQKLMLALVNIMVHVILGMIAVVVGRYTIMAVWK